MTIVSHTHEFIFLKTRKTAGSAIELWLADYLVPRRDLIASAKELRTLKPDIAQQLSGEIGGFRGRVRALTGHDSRLGQHMPALRVRQMVGSRVWRRYRKITVVRNPWDRIISFWRWRQRRMKQAVTLEEFITAIESGSNETMKACSALGWDNWPIYSIDDVVVADEVIRYENLNEDLRRVCGEIGIALTELPRAKTGIRKPQDTTDILTRSQCARIAALFKKEIEVFGYVEPHQCNPTHSQLVTSQPFPSNTEKVKS